MKDKPVQNQKKTFRASIFLIWLILIEMCWILGTKVSEMLLDYITGLTFSQIQVAESLFSYSIALTIFFWGYVVDRYNHKRKHILVLSSILWILASILLFALETSFFLYSCVQIIWGLSFGASGPLIASYLGDLFKIEQRGKLFSIFTIFIYIIKGSNIAVNGIIGTLVNDWKFPTFLFAIIGIVLIAFFYLFGREPSIAQNEPEFRKQPDFVYDYHPDLGEVKLVLRKKTNLLFLIQGIFGMIGVVTVTRYLSYWFTSSQFDGLGINIGVAILLLGIGGAIGGLLGILLVGRWIDYQFKQGKIRRILYFAILCVFLQVFLYIFLILGINYPESINRNITNVIFFIQQYPAFIFFIIIFNFCVFCGTPIGTTVGVARTHINLPEHRGTAGSIYDLTDFIGSGLGIMIASIFLTLFSSYRLTIMCGSLFWIASGVIWVLITKHIETDFKDARKILQKRANYLKSKSQ